VRPAIAIVALLAVCFVVYSCGMASDQGRLFNFDGWVAEPGCDLGNPNCEPEDIRESCRYPSDEQRLLVERYCPRPR